MSSVPEPETSKGPIDFKLGLILLLLCSSVFALYNSNAAYSSDEVWSVKVASQDYSELLTALKADVHPPLYFQMLHPWIRLFGVSERAVRSLSGVFYVLAGLALYGLGRELFESRTALLCATLYATSPLAILSAQFARMYALLSLLSILSTWVYLQFTIKARNSRLAFALYIAVNILGTFTHIAFFFVLFAQIVFYLLFYRRKQTKTLVTTVALSAIPYLILWAPIFLGQMRNPAVQQGLAWVKKPGLSMIPDLFLLYGGVFWLLVPLLLYLSWRNRFKFWTGLEKARLPLWLLALTLLVPLLISIVKPVFNSRLAIVGLHLFALVVSALVGRFAGYVLPIILIVITGGFLIAVHPSSQACDNRALANYLATRATDNDVAIFTSLTRMPVDYYLQQAPAPRKLFETSFPGEIDNHPGYEGLSRDAGRRKALEIEAQELVDRITLMQSRNRELRVFFFHGMHPELDALLEKRLQERFWMLSDQQVQCTEGSAYLKTISVYKRSPASS